MIALNVETSAMLIPFSCHSIQRADMASTSSRDAALERRKALTSGGKKSAGRYTSAPSRVRTASDARPSRTTAAPPETSAVSARAEVAQSPAPVRRSLTPPSAGGAQRSSVKPVSNPSRELVLARREALSRRGKRADPSRDRTNSENRRPSSSPTVATPTSEPKCKCQGHGPERPSLSAPSSRGPAPDLSASLANRQGRNGAGRSSTPKRASQHNPSRALVLARREALSKRGKSASTSSHSAAAVARQANPDLSSRELAQKVRDLKSKIGSAGSARNSGTRPTGPNKNGARQAAAADAHWKVGVSETARGQVVTGTQANRSLKTTGNEAATCRTITGTEYLGAEVFQAFCGKDPAPQQPAKVRVTATSHGNRVTGNEVGRSEKVTGDEPGTCQSVTGTEYISANQAVSYCGTGSPAPRKVGQGLTASGLPVSGVMVGRSERVTGDESGSGLQITGDQYLNQATPVAGRAPTKVASLHTLRGTGITGTHVGRSEHVTGDEPGSCRIITGDEYIGSQQYAGFCGTRPAPEAAKVGFSVTNKALVVSGTRTGRSDKVTGDEPGTCKAVTGTPYAGLEEAGNWCSSKQVEAVRQRTPVRMGYAGARLSGIQPGIGGVMTGAERGACEPISGTPYVGEDQFNAACSAATPTDGDFPQPLAGQQPWQQFSVQSPARAAQSSREQSLGVTGSSYELGGRITGPFAMATDKVTGTAQFRHDHRAAQPSRLEARGDKAPAVPTPEVAPVSRVTGEGSGKKITGDDWDRGERVTGTEGRSARRRNPTRTGAMAAMPAVQPKRNEEVPAPLSRVTGSSGSTDRGSLVTVSGGARG